MNEEDALARVVNDYHIGINKCCASCKNKVVENDGTRRCPVIRKLVEQREVCDQWTIADGLAQAGNSRGKVKSRAYLRYLLAVRAEESTAIQRKTMTANDIQSVEDVRMEYESKFNPHCSECTNTLLKKC